MQATFHKHYLFSVELIANLRRQPFFHQRQRTASGCSKRTDGLHIALRLRIPVDGKEEIHPAIVEEHSSRRAHRMKARDIDAATLHERAHTQWQRQQPDRVAARQNPSELVQSLLVLKEITMQS